MRDTRRSLALWITTGFRAAPFLAGLQCLLFTLQTLAAPAQAYSIKMITEGVAASDTAVALTGVTLLTASFLAGLLAMAVTIPVEAWTNDHVYRFLHSRILSLTMRPSDIEHHERADIADRIALIHTNARAMSYSIGDLAAGVAALAQAVVILSLLAGVHPILLVLPLLGLVKIGFGARSGRIRQQAAEKTAIDDRVARNLITLSGDARHGLELRTFGLGPELLRSIRGRLLRVQQVQRQALQRGTAIDVLTRASFGLMYGAAVVFALHLAINGSITAGDVALVILLAPQVDSAAGLLAERAIRVGAVARMFSPYRWLIDYAGGRTSAGDQRPPAQIRNGISLHDVGFSYPEAQRDALASVTVDLPAGSTVALVGENGAGKTTLVKILTRLHEPSVGRITIDDHDLTAIDPDAWRKMTSAAFQDFVRHQATVAENVGLGDLEQADDPAAIQAALDRAGATELIMDLPAGIHTPVGTLFAGGQELSGGQWQRLAIARAFMRRSPSLLLLDEPSAALDPEAEHAIVSRLLREARTLGRTTGAVTILVSHRLSTVRMADLIIMLESGKISEQGTHEQLLANDGPYAELFRLQAKAYRRSGKR